MTCKWPQDAPALTSLKTTVLQTDLLPPGFPRMPPTALPGVEGLKEAGPAWRGYRGG